MNFDFREIDCPVCGEGKFRTVGYRGGEAHHSGSGVRTRIVRCVNCTHQYPNPMPFPRTSLSEMYGTPDDYFANHDLEDKKSKALGLVREFEKRLDRKGALLDVGSGRGEVLWAARQSGWEFKGIEPSQHFVEFGKKHLGVDTDAGSLEEALLPESRFDAVVMNGLIEHLYEPAAAMKEIRRVIRPGGWLYFDAPNEDGVYMKLGNAYMRLRGRDWVVVLAPTFSPFHVQGFNPRSLKILLKETGFRIQDFSVHGDVFPQMGAQTLRKKIEFHSARIVNAIGNRIGRGSYMTVWAQPE